MKVYIPSRGRGDHRVASGPAAQMRTDQDVVYVVSREDASSYVNSLSEYGVGAKILICPVVGIAAKRLWIAVHALRQGEEKLCMIDDDVGFLVRRSPDSWQLRGAEPDEIGEMLDWVESALDEHAHVSISSREGNNRAGVGDRDALVRLNTRPQRVLAYRTREYKACDHLRVQLMEDFDIALQLLEKGYSNAVSYWWAQGQRMTNEDGGCSTYRTKDLHDICARSLVALHPQFVSLRDKENKTDRDGLGTRTEVTVQWKAAYEQGKLVRGDI